LHRMKRNSILWSIGWGAICLLMSFILFLFSRYYYADIRTGNDFLISFGAILSPFMSLFAAIMFYRAISAQTESNNIQGRSSDISIILKLIDYLIADIGDFHYEVKNNSLSGIDAWIAEQFDNTVHTSFITNPMYFRFHSIMYSFVFIMESIEKSNLKDYQKKPLNARLSDLYLLRISPIYIKYIEIYKAKSKGEAEGLRELKGVNDKLMGLVKKNIG